MPEFRIENDALKRQAKFRILSWGVVFLLLAVTAVILTLHATGYVAENSDHLGSLFALAVIGAALISLILAPREGLSRAERKMVFALDDERIVRKRQGYPDVEIAFSEVETLSEELRWLVITSAEPRRKIAIPRNVGGYELIRAQLAKHHPLSARIMFPLKSATLLAISVLSWIAVLWLRDMSAIIAGVTVAVITLAFGSYQSWLSLRRSSKSLLLWTYLGLAWLSALSLVYIRLRRW